MTIDEKSHRQDVNRCCEVIDNRELDTMTLLFVVPFFYLILQDTFGVVVFFKILLKRDKFECSWLDGFAS